MRKCKFGIPHQSIKFGLAIQSQVLFRLERLKITKRLNGIRAHIHIYIRWQINTVRHINYISKAP